MAMAPTQKHREFAVSTPLKDDVLLFRSMEGSEELSRLFQYDLELLSEQADVDLNKVVGESMTVRVNLGNGKSRFFNGIVSRFAQVGFSGSYVQYEATLVPWLWLLTRTSDCRIFQFKQMTIPKIIKQVFKSFGFSGSVDDRLSGKYREWSYCVQYRETAFNFVSRLMEQEGIYYYFAHDNGKHTLVLADSPGSHDVRPSFEKLAFQPTRSETDSPFLMSWSVGRYVLPGTCAQTDYDFTDPRKTLKASKSIKREHANASFEMFDYPGEYSERKDGENYSRVRIEELQAEHEIFEAGSNARGITTGCVFDFVEHPRKDQNQQYLITGVSHEIIGDPYEAGASQAGTDFSCHLSAIPANQQFRPPRISPKPLIQGPQTATVVGPDGEEIHTDEYGRIKVKFHWDRHYENADKSACWIRVAQVWAGSGWGGMTIPRIGQEVMVEFCEGDPDCPLVTGRVYNKNQMPPYKLPDGKVISGLKSNSTPGGGGYNEFIMDDTKDKELIRVHGQYDMDTTIEHDLREHVLNDRSRDVTNNETVQVGGNQSVTIDKNRTEKVKENEDYRVVADRKETVEGNRHLVVTKEKFEKVSSNSHTIVAGDRSERVAGTSSLQTSNVHVEASDLVAIKGGMEVHLIAGMKLTIEASSEITIKAGGNFIKLGPDGVTIMGSPMTKINSGGAAGDGSGVKTTDPTEAKEAETGD